MCDLICTIMHTCFVDIVYVKQLSARDILFSFESITLFFRTTSLFVFSVLFCFSGVGILYLYSIFLWSSLIIRTRLIMQDDDPYVRKTAAICVAKLHDINAELVEDRGFLEDLTNMISDSNPMVVANAVAALAEIQEGSSKNVFEITNHTLFKLLAALNECTEYAFSRLVFCFWASWITHEFLTVNASTLLENKTFRMVRVYLQWYMKDQSFIADIQCCLTSRLFVIYAI